jgi:hypothetical protein
MSQLLSFTTLKVGAVIIELAPRQTIELDVRVLLGSDGRYRVLTGELSGPLPSLEAALAETTPLEVHWRDDLAPVPPAEHPCPICAAPASFSTRYTRLLCPACVLEAADASGRPLRFANLNLGAGFAATYADDGAPYPAHECFVRGVSCVADEGYFGGIVVQIRAD